MDRNRDRRRRQGVFGYEVQGDSRGKDQIGPVSPVGVCRASPPSRAKRVDAMERYLQHTLPFAIVIQLAATLAVTAIDTASAADGLPAKVDLTPEFQRLELPAHCAGQ